MRSSLRTAVLEWQKKFGTEKACANALFHVRWPEGFYCPRCGCKKSSYITTRKTHQCSKCKYHVSLTTDLILDNGQEIAANIIDISPTGIGVKIPLNAKKTQTLKIGERVTFRCSWNSRLLGHGRYVVKNINARQIGFEKNRSRYGSPPAAGLPATACPLMPSIRPPPFLLHTVRAYELPYARNHEHRFSGL